MFFRYYFERNYHASFGCLFVALLYVILVINIPTSKTNYPKGF